MKLASIKARDIVLADVRGDRFTAQAACP